MDEPMIFNHSQESVDTSTKIWGQVWSVEDQVNLSDLHWTVCFGSLINLFPHLLISPVTSTASSSSSDRVMVSAAMMSQELPRFKFIIWLTCSRVSWSYTFSPALSSFKTSNVNTKTRFARTSHDEWYNRRTLMVVHVRVILKTSRFSFFPLTIYII